MNQNVYISKIDLTVSRSNKDSINFWIRRIVLANEKRVYGERGCS